METQHDSDHDYDGQQESEEQGQGSPSKRGKIRRWTEQEHEMLVQLVEQLGEDACWATIAEHIPGRTGKQCRERWVNHIGSDIKKGNWTAEEEDHMARLHATMGPAWTRIASTLGGRTENSVKNHFNALLRSKRLNDKKSSILAQYVRIVRDKTNAGMPAYEQAVALAAAADETHSQHSQPSSKSKRSSQQTASHASHGTDARNSPHAMNMGLGSPMASVGMAGMPNVATIRTGRTMSGTLQHATSYPAPIGSPVIANTPMSAALTQTPMSGPHMNDATAALAAAVAAVQAAAQAVAGVASTGAPQGNPLGMRASGVATGAANYTSRNGSATLGMGMGPGQALGMEGCAASEAMTDTMQYSPGMGGSRVPVPAPSSISASLNSTMQDDGLGTRSSLRLGMRGRPMGMGLNSAASGPLMGGGNMVQQTILEGSEQYGVWQQQQQQCEGLQDMGRCMGESGHLQGQPGVMVMAGPDGQYQYMHPANAMEGMGAPMRAMQGSSPHPYGSKHRMATGSSAGGALLCPPDASAANTSALTAALQEQVAQLAGMLRRPLAAAGGPGSGSSETKVDMSMLGSMGGPGMSSMGGAALGLQAGGATSNGGFLGDVGMAPASRYPSMQLQQGLQQGMVADVDGMMHTLKSMPSRGMTGGGAGLAIKEELQAGAPGMAGFSSGPTAEPAAPSAASLTLGMQEFVGPNGYSSAFVNQQNLELGSPPRSPPHRPPTTAAAAAALNSAMFSNLPPHASYDLMAALQHEGSMHEPALLGRLSGLSLEAMFGASPLCGRPQSLSHMYFSPTGQPSGMRNGQGQHQGMLSQSSGMTGMAAMGRPEGGLQGTGVAPMLGSPGQRAGSGHVGAALGMSRLMGGPNGAGTSCAGDTGLQGVADDLSLSGLRPLTVKTRKAPQGGHDGSAEQPLVAAGSVLPAYVEQEGTPASGAKLLNMPAGGSSGGGALLLNENGTPTANGLTELLFAWGQEPATPANAVLAQGPTSFSGAAGHRMGQGCGSGGGARMAGLATAADGTGLMFDYQGQRMGGQDVDHGASTYDHNNPLHQLFRPPANSLDGTNTVDVPPPEVMGCLDIIFDEEDTLEGPNAAAAGLQPPALPPPSPSLLDPQHEMGRYYQQQDQQAAAAAGVGPIQVQPQDPLGMQTASGAVNAASPGDGLATSCAASFTTPQQLGHAGSPPQLPGQACSPQQASYPPAMSPQLSPQQAFAGAGQQQPPVGFGSPQPAFSPPPLLQQQQQQQQQMDMSNGGTALTIEGSLPGAAARALSPGLGVTPDMAHRMSAQRQLSLKGLAGVPLSGSGSLLRSPAQAGVPTGSAGAPATTSNKRSSTQIWGDAYSLGHSSAKRSTAHGATSSPGDPAEATPTYAQPAPPPQHPQSTPVKPNFAHRRLTTWMPTGNNDPYARCNSEPGGAGVAQQLSAESSGTPHVCIPTSVQSSPMQQQLHGPLRGGMTGGGGVYTFSEWPQSRAVDMAPQTQGMYGEGAAPAAHMVKAGMDQASAMAWSSVFDAHPLQYQQQQQHHQQQHQQQQLLMQQHMGQYLANSSTGMEAPQQQFGGGNVQMGGVQGGAMPGRFDCSNNGGMARSKLMVSSGPVSNNWEDGLVEFGLHGHGGSVDGPGSAALHAAMGPKEVAAALGAQM